MVRYHLECPDGHAVGTWPHRPPSPEQVADCLICECGKPMDLRREVVNVNFSGATVLHEHFNESLGCVVKGKTHLRELQRERGVVDYEPDSDATHSKRLWRREQEWEAAREKIRKAVGDIAVTAPRGPAKPYRAPDRERRERELADERKRMKADMEAMA